MSILATDISTREIAEFLDENSTRFIGWDWVMLLEFVNYFRDHGAMGIVRKDDEIVGVGVARPIPFRNAQVHALDLWSFQENGEILFIEELVATNTKAIPILWNMMVERFGERPLVGGRRHSKLRVWDFEKYVAKMNLLLRKAV